MLMFGLVSCCRLVGEEGRKGVSGVAEVQLSCFDKVRVGHVAGFWYGGW